MFWGEFRRPLAALDRCTLNKGAFAFKIVQGALKWPLKGGSRLIVAATAGLTVFRNSRLCAKFENQDYNGILLDDSGYALNPYLTPILNPQTPPERRYNYSYCRTEIIWCVETVFCVPSNRVTDKDFMLRKSVFLLSKMSLFLFTSSKIISLSSWEKMFRFDIIIAISTLVPHQSSNTQVSDGRVHVNTKPELHSHSS